MKIDSNTIRQKYLDFFEKRGHKIIPSSSLIPENDPTTLFTGSWMQPMVPYLLWEKHPLWKRIVDSQKCFRSGDIDDIWDNRHTTFFEMLGNWSLWDYFKEEQIYWMFEFLTKELELNPQKLYISVYRWNKKINIWEDKQTVNLWKEQFKKVWIDAKDINYAEDNWMQDGKIFYYDDKENWWSRAWIPDNMPVLEPWWPDSEMFWDFWAELKNHEKSKWKDKHCHPACDCGRFLEIWNNVFMQYIKTDNGFEELKNKNIDFWWWLERLTIAVSDIPDVYYWDLFDWIRNKIEELTGKKYGEKDEETIAFRVIMDHLRAATFLICDWAVPSNKDGGYFTRRLIRRAIRFVKKLWVKGGFIEQVAKEVINWYSSHYKDLLKKQDFIISEMKKEEKQFLTTIDIGLKEFEKKSLFTWVEVFDLYQTFGFPLEMTLELLAEKEVSFDKEKLINDFNIENKKHKDKAREWAKKKFSWWLSDDLEKTIALHSATHLMLAWLKKILSPDVSQKWSNITAERLRFDFNYHEKVDRWLLEKVEEYVNEAISKNCEVVCIEMNKNIAKESWVIGSFWEKYPDIVKVYTFKDSLWNIYSKEMCWGPHVKNTKNMWKFKIKKEEASSSWVRRIKAILIKE